MLSKYFEMKTETEEFKNRFNSIIERHKDKKIIVYGAGDGFFELNKRYNLDKIFEVVAVADRKFTDSMPKLICGMKPISPSDINEKEFDVILVTNEYYNPIVEYLENSLNIAPEKIETVFDEDVKDAQFNYNYTESFGLKKYLKRLKKKLKDKTIVIYGAGILFELIKKYYNLEGLNIIGICDKRFQNHAPDEEFLGYKIFSLKEMKELCPDYLIVATKYYVKLMDDLYSNVINGTKIKIKPLVDKPFFELIKELWD